MVQTGKCSICGLESELYECTNEDCKTLTCMDCVNDYILPLVEYYKNTPNFPLMKCPSCGSDLRFNP